MPNLKDVKSEASNWPTGWEKHWNIITLYTAMEMALQTFLVEQDR